VKVGEVPARKAVLVQLHDVVDFAGGGFAVTDLREAFVQQSHQSIGLVALYVAAKVSLAPNHLLLT